MKPVKGDFSTHLMMWKASHKVDWPALARLRPRDEEDWARLHDIIYGWLNVVVREQSNYGLTPNRDHMGDQLAIHVDYDSGEGWLEYWYDDWPTIRVEARYWSEADDTEYERTAGAFEADKMAETDHWTFITQLETLTDRFSDAMRDWYEDEEDDEGHDEEG